MQENWEELLIIILMIPVTVITMVVCWRIWYENEKNATYWIKKYRQERKYRERSELRLSQLAIVTTLNWICSALRRSKVQPENYQEEYETPQAKERETQTTQSQRLAREIEHLEEEIQDLEFNWRANENAMKLERGLEIMENIEETFKTYQDLNEHVITTLTQNEEWRAGASRYKKTLKTAMETARKAIKFEIEKTRRTRGVITHG